MFHWILANTQPTKAFKSFVKKPTLEKTNFKKFVKSLIKAKTTKWMGSFTKYEISHCSLFYSDRINFCIIGVTVVEGNLASNF